MSIVYPQAAVVLRCVWENYGQEGNAFLSAPYTLKVMAKRVRVAINDYTKADTFEVEIDYKNFPFDPRTLRSVQVSIHIENMDGLGKAIVPKSPDEDRAGHNAVLIGFADEESIELSDDSRTVVLKGRDYTAIYIDARHTGKILALDKPVDKVIETLIGELKASGQIKVENRTGLSTLPTLAKYASDFGPLSGKRNARKNESYWDVIQHVASTAALVAYIELDRLVLTTPKVLYKPDKAVQFFYGKNLKKLEMSRKIGRLKGFNVRVKALVGKEVLIADIPKDAKNLDVKGKDVILPKLDAQGKIVEGAEATAPFQTFFLSKIKDKDALIDYGEKIWEELGRQQIEGKFSTHEMVGFDGSKNQIELTKLRNGAPVKIEVDAMDMTQVARLKAGFDKTSYLVGRGYQPRVAEALSQAMGKFDTVFYTRAIDMSLSAENGFSIDIDFINFIETNNKGLGI